MQKKDKIYEKPELKPIKMLEVGAAQCCRMTVQLCNNAVRVTKTKTQNAS
jgi:hypothetical protein